MKIIILILFINTIISANPLLNYPNEIESNELTILKQKLQNYDDEIQYTISEFNTKNINYSKIKTKLKTLFPKITIIYNKPKHSLIIKHSKNDYDKIKSLIKSLDRTTKEIYFKCNLYELSINSQKEFDFFNDILQHPLTLTKEKSFKITNANSLLDSIKVLESTGKAILIAQPTIKLIDNFKSTIKIGDKVPYITTSYNSNNTFQQINSFNTGITLSIFPSLTETQIKCDINLNLTHIKYWKTVNKQTLPVIAERELITSSYFKEKTTTLLGNYINLSKTTNKNQSPLIKKIPILKTLFNYNRFSENKTILLIFITPYI